MVPGEATPEKRAKQLYRWLYTGYQGKWMRSLEEGDGDPLMFSAAFKAKVRPVNEGVVTAKRRCGHSKSQVKV